MSNSNVGLSSPRSGAVSIAGCRHIPMGSSVEGRKDIHQTVASG